MCFKAEKDENGTVILAKWFVNIRFACREQEEKIVMKSMKKD